MVVEVSGLSVMGPPSATATVKADAKRIVLVIFYTLIMQGLSVCFDATLVSIMPREIPGVELRRLP